MKFLNLPAAASRLLRLLHLSPLLFGAIMVAEVANAQQRADLVIENITIVDIATAELLESQTILIADGVFVGVDNAGSVNVESSVPSVDGQNLYGIPGLADMHVHLDADDLNLYIANGITTVLDMNGSPDAIAMRSRIEDGSLLGPRVYMSSPLLAGTAQNFAYQLVANAEQSRQAVLDSYAAGYDFIKVYDGLSEAAYSAMVVTARALGMPLLGHIPQEVGLQRVLDDQQLSIEHVEQIARATVGHSFDQSRIPGIVAQIAAGSSAVTPTLAVMEVLSARRTQWFDQLFDRPEMNYTPNSIEGWWNSFRAPVQARENLSQTSTGGSSAEIEFYRALTRALNDADVLLLAGTDTPNPLMIPGYALQHEFAALSRAGLSNAEILASATIAAARHLNAANQFGDIKPGLRADMVLLRENPLVNIEALNMIAGVVVNGRWLDQDRISSLLSEVVATRN